MENCKKTKVKLKGYDIYKTEEKNKKKSLAYITKVKEKIDSEYAEISDINEAYTLLKRAKQKVFIKEEISLGLVLGLIGFAVPYFIEHTLGEYAKDLTFNYQDLIHVIVITLVVSVFFCGFLIWVMQKIAQSYKNIYRLFVLPYEIEVLEREIKKIESNNKSEQNERG